MDKSLREHDGVVLLRDLPEAGLLAGETGVAVYPYENGLAFEVQFPSGAGAPGYIVVTVEAGSLLKLHPRAEGRRAAGRIT